MTDPTDLDAITELLDDRSTESDDGDLVRMLASFRASVMTARAMLLAAMKGQPGFLETARQQGVVTLIRAPDADWDVEIAIAWRLLSILARPPTTPTTGTAGSRQPSRPTRAASTRWRSWTSKRSPLPPCDGRSGSGAPHGPSTRNWIIPMNTAVAPFSGPLCWLKHLLCRSEHSPAQMAFLGAYLRRRQ